MRRLFRCLLGLLIAAMWVSIGQIVQGAQDTLQTASTPASVSQESATISIPEDTYDFGEIVEGGEVIHDFTVKNTGTAPLEINQVRPG